MPYLIHQYNGSPISHIQLGDSLSIGRGEGNDLQLDDPTISQSHAQIRQLAAGEYELRDSGSTNGTLLRGKRITASRLTDGDVILVGTHELCFVEALPDQYASTAKIKKSWIPGIYYTSEK